MSTKRLELPDRKQPEPTNREQMARSDKEAKKLLSDIRPMINEVEGKAAEEVVEHVSTFLNEQVERKKETEKRLHVKPKPASQPKASGA
jgi:hypothetical protein